MACDGKCKCGGRVGVSETMIEVIKEVDDRFDGHYDDDIAIMPTPLEDPIFIDTLPDEEWISDSLKLSADSARKWAFYQSYWQPWFKSQFTSREKTLISEVIEDLSRMGYPARAQLQAILKLREVAFGNEDISKDLVYSLDDPAPFENEVSEAYWNSVKEQYSGRVKPEDRVVWDNWKEEE